MEEAAGKAQPKALQSIVLPVLNIPGREKQEERRAYIGPTKVIKPKTKLAGEITRGYNYELH